MLYLTTILGVRLRKTDKTGVLRLATICNCGRGSPSPKSLQRVQSSGAMTEGRSRQDCPSLGVWAGPPSDPQLPNPKSFGSQDLVAWSAKPLFVGSIPTRASNRSVLKCLTN